MATVQSKVYEAIIGECERMQLAGQYTGNGHHLAQRLAKMVEDADSLAVAPVVTAKAAPQWIPHQPETWPFRYGSLKKPLVMFHNTGKWAGNEPVSREVPLTAGTTVKIVMVSRFGDIGITEDLTAERGYGARIMLEDLENLRNSPEIMPESKPLDCLKYCKVVEQTDNKP
jgi:hypothetical protein